MKTPIQAKGKERGVSLIIVILVIAFMLTVGIALVTITSTGPAVAGNLRLQEQAFNSAEAGFDAAWNSINNTLGAGGISDFSALYRTTYNGQPGLDDPNVLGPNYQNYFRRLTDQQLVDDVARHNDNYLFDSQPMPDDVRLSYTAFMVKNEANGETPNPMSAILVCIGKGPRNTYSRLEIVIQIQQK
jgi:hypothetical protein